MFFHSANIYSLTDLTLYNIYAYSDIILSRIFKHSGVGKIYTSNLFDIWYFLQIALNSQRNRCFLSSRLNIIWASSFCLSKHTLSIQVLFNKRIGLLDKFSSSYVWWKVYHKENLTRNSTSLTAAFMWR